MSSIDEFTFSRWGGFMPRPVRAIGVLPNFPNVDGVSLAAGAYTTQTAKIDTTAIVTSINEANDLMDSYIDLQGDPVTQVTVVDQFGISYEGCVIIAVVPQMMLPVDGTVWVMAQWAIQVPTYEP